MAKELKFDGRFACFQGRFGLNRIEVDINDKRLEKHWPFGRWAHMYFGFTSDKVRDIPFDVGDDLEIIIKEYQTEKECDGCLVMKGRFRFQSRWRGNKIELLDRRLAFGMEDLSFKFRFAWPHIRDIPFNTGDMVNVIIKKKVN